ncbi:hypothetical protein [Pseudoalteromonas sp. HF66]|uniref:hypothetical protein n=1 Tax=Pseudoalteromonas sp. HF66 TaxID=2721559 RepID=UPI001431711B|nr:hypothetical protein [Pseudoalteromonas sp. HF66]NIZ06424.1 hypothetical protein [Pseudoalteromonas sp. HF66]
MKKNKFKIKSKNDLPVKLDDKLFDSVIGAHGDNCQKTCARSCYLTCEITDSKLPK